MESHAHPYLPRFRGPPLRVERKLGVDSSLQSLGSGRKSSLESIAYYLIGIPAVGFYRLAENGFLAGEVSAHRRGVGFPAFGAPLYFGE